MGLNQNTWARFPLTFGQKNKQIRGEKDYYARKQMMQNMIDTLLPSFLLPNVYNCQIEDVLNRSLKTMQSSLGIAVQEMKRSTVDQKKKEMRIHEFDGLEHP